MAPLGKRAIFWHSVKTFVFYKLFKHFRAKLKSKKIFAAAIASLLVSGFVYKLIDYLVDKMLCYIFNMESMNVMDEFFMNCKEGKPPNAAGLMTTNRFDFEKAKAEFIKKGEWMPRSRTKII